MASNSENTDTELNMLVSEESVEKQRAKEEKRPVALVGQWLGRPRTTHERLILEFYPSACFSGGTGIVELERVPPELERFGITEEVWLEWMNKLKEIQKQNHGIFVCIASLIIFPLLVYTYLNARAYQGRMREFMADFNEKVMIPHGLFAKLRTRINQGRDRIEVSWMAISLTAADTDLLRAEDAVDAYFLSWRIPLWLSFDRNRVV